MNRIFISFILCLCLLPLAAQEVAEDEFLGTGPIEFTHFTGEYDHINTLEEIQGIGRSLASTTDIFQSGKSRYGHFLLAHSYQPEIPDGLDGDILILTQSSGVDHVRNIRHIIAGFLEDAYGYNYDRAYVLAEFLTYYNAVHYQDIAHFNQKYKPGVMEHLTPDRCGMSRIYSEWPGRARIVIPLRNPNQEGLSSVDTSIISDEEVIDEMQLEEDANLDVRKDMVEIREEENRQEQEQLEEKREEVQEEQQIVEEELQELEEKEATEELTEEEEERRDELVERQEELQEREEQIEEEQEELDQRTEEVLDERDEIARDENRQIDEGRDSNEPSEQESVFVGQEEEGPVPMHFFHYSGNENGVPFGSIFLYDLQSGNKTSESTVTTLYGREYTQYNALFLGIGKSRNSGEVHLMLIDKENLGLLKESTVGVHPGSRIEIDQSNRIFAISELDGTYYLARFNEDLELDLRSSQPVDPFTDILFYNGKIFVQDERGAMVELNIQSLEAEKEYR